MRSEKQIVEEIARRLDIIKRAHTYSILRNNISAIRALLWCLGAEIKNNTIMGENFINEQLKKLNFDKFFFHNEN